MIEHKGVDRALVWHLRSNHYPPVPDKMIPVCQKAIDRVNAGDKKKIRLPENTLYRGSTLVEPWDVIESLHLEPFLDQDDNDYL
jgi:hypothetical protein